MGEPSNFKGKHELCKHNKPCLHNALTGLGWGALIGLVFRTALTTFTLLVRKQLFKNPLRILEAFKLNNMRIVAFLSLMVGSFRASLCALRRWTNDEAKASFGAGFIAGIPLIFEEKSTRVTFALYFFARGIDVLIKHLVSVGTLPRVPHFYEICFIISTGYMHFLKTFEPECLNRSYSKVIDRLLIDKNDKFIFGMGRK